MSKKELAVRLSKLKTFENPNVMMEQYPTDSEIAAEVLWFAMLKGDIEGKIIADFGAGTGTLGIGSLLLGTKKVFFIEKDEKAVQILQENLDFEEISEEKYVLIKKDLEFFQEKTDVVIQNPPFGTKEKHADSDFLKKAMLTAPVIYTFHKTETEKFIQEKANSNSFICTNKFEFNFPIKKIMEHHKKRIEHIKVTCFRFEKDN
ncbi:MAG: METTL5 family protein [Nanoarchaeota archaeon]|nr:METTL5 family protein [Nanoarchaeota archaeon]MBU1029898.1 METTL5 family protein [Nanoarchaeota archaeon]MBU1849821.1 METTL5 family protein [Nanoarchaeota archaeon]